MNFSLVNASEHQKDEESAERLWEVVTRSEAFSNNTQESLEQLLNSVSQDDVRFVGGHKIRKFDVIKLGRFKFRVKDLACEQMGLTEEELFEQELKEARQVITLGTQESETECKGPNTSTSQGQCRFCWGTESNEENPCIVPCKCSGSVGFIHY